MNLLEFEPRHIAWIEAEGGRAVFGDRPFDVAHAQMCAEHPAWSAVVGDRIIACGGVFREHETAGLAWTLLLPSTSAHMLALTRAANKFMNATRLTHIQAHAAPGCPPAARWLELLGFDLVGTLRKFTPNGADMLLYQRVR